MFFHMLCTAFRELFRSIKSFLKALYSTFLLRSALSGLPARIIKHTLSNEELVARFPDGYKELPEEIYKRLHIIPETFIVDEHHVHVYASKNNDGTILKAPRPKDLFRNSIATPALVASIINGKYTNALPLERQSKTFRTNGIQLSSNTMANWVIKSTDIYLSLIYDRLHEIIYDSKVIHADESPVKVMQIDHARIKNGKKTYMRVYRNRPLRGTHPIVLFEMIFLYQTVKNSVSLFFQKK